MLLHTLKKTVARVDVAGKPNGTAFLVGPRHVATALHVLNRRRQVKLVFVDWPADRERTGTLHWRHPRQDVAILELDRACPDDVRPSPWNESVLRAGSPWYTFGFPSSLSDGHVLHDEQVNDPSLRIEALDATVLQLHTSSAREGLGGLSGAPCVVAGGVAGIVSFQLYRPHDDAEYPPAPDASPEPLRPSLETLYALPIELLAGAAIQRPGHADVAPVLDENAIDTDSVWYVHRTCDSLAEEQVGRPRSLLRIFGPSKMGKTSLLYRLSEKVASSATPVSIDLGLLGEPTGLTTGDVFRYILAEVSRAMRLSEAILARLDETPTIGPQACRNFIEDHVLRRADASVFLAFDNLDHLARRPDLSDSLQQALRAWHEAGARNTPWRRLRLAIACTTSLQMYIGRNIPSPLANVGTPIELTDFTEDELTELLRQHGLPTTLTAPLARLGGHPYMVRRTLYALKAQVLEIERIYEDAHTFRGPLGHYLEQKLRGLSPELKAALASVIDTHRCHDFDQRRLLAGAGLIRLSSPTEATPRYPLFESVLRNYL